MKASRRDFVKIVDIIRRLEKGETKRLMWAIALVDVLKASNPRFKAEEFIEAVRRK